MKTAISLPDELFSRVQRHAERLGLSRSEFFAIAAGRWLDELEGADLTAALNLALACAGPDDDREFVSAAARSVIESGD
ncbi:MAG: ribbon-helix-helix protein, CopG family [Sporichthyaceae bacterium]